MSRFSINYSLTNKQNFKINPKITFHLKSIPWPKHTVFSVVN